MIIAGMKFAEFITQTGKFPCFNAAEIQAEVRGFTFQKVWRGIWNEYL